MNGVGNFSLHVGLDSSSMKFDTWYEVSMLLGQKKCTKSQDLREAELEGRYSGGLKMKWWYLFIR